MGIANLSDQQHSTYIELDPPFREACNVSLDSIESLTQQTFRAIIKQHTDQGLPFFLAIFKHREIKYLAAGPFLRLSFVHDPLTPEQYATISIYKIETTASSIFKYFCNFKQLLANNGHYFKMINACDLTYANKFRSEECVYLGAIHSGTLVNGKEMVSQDLDQAKFWYKQAAKAGNFSGYLNLANIYAKCETENSRKKQLKYLEKGLESMPEGFPNYKELHEYYQTQKAMQD